MTPVRRRILTSQSVQQALYSCGASHRRKPMRQFLFKIVGGATGFAGGKVIRGH